ncbi:MAG: hypothetical protein ACOC1X_02650 [Promethearchaeota archaeon]
MKQLKGGLKTSKMKNILEHMFEKKKGQMGIGVAKTFVVGLLSLVVIGVTVMIVLNSLGDTSVVEDDNATQSVIDNASGGLGDFFTNTGTWLALLAVVIIILIISAVVLVVNRFGEGGAKSPMTR